MTRYVAGVIDHNVPLATFQSLESVITISYKQFQIREQFIVGSTTIEKTDFMAAPQRFSNHVRPYEAGAAKDQDVQRFPWIRLCIRLHRNFGRASCYNRSAAKKTRL